MSLAATIVAVLVGLLGGIFGGLKLGEKVRGRAGAYWALNGIVIVVCMLIDFAGLALGYLWLAMGAVGLMGGAITGLKYGYSESIGIWRTIDMLTGTDVQMREKEDDAEDQPAS